MQHDEKNHKVVKDDFPKQPQTKAVIGILVKGMKFSEQQTASERRGTCVIVDMSANPTSNPNQLFI